jgi:hypothetical protein
MDEVLRHHPISDLVGASEPLAAALSDHLVLSFHVIWKE